MGYKKLSNEQEIQIVEEYKQGISCKVLMNKYGFKTQKSITDKIRKHFPEEYDQIIELGQYNRKKYHYNMEKINNEFDAYFLGLLLTDGYVSLGNSKKKRHQVGVDLVDEDCISFLSKSIGKEYSRYESYQKDRFNQKTRYRLILESEELVNNLQRFGVVPRKSKTLQPPQLTCQEERFLPYIIRGIIDGDGTVSPTSYGGAQFRIVTASVYFAQWLQYVLTNKMYMIDISINTKLDNRFENSTTLYSVGSADQGNIQKLIALSYNKPFGMMRKYNQITETFRDYNQD